MSKTKPAGRKPLQPLETGQVWRVTGLNFTVGLIGKWLVHYKLAKPNAVRISNSVGGRTTIRLRLRTSRITIISTNFRPTRKAWPMRRRKI
jgi:hypothetical protein